MKIRLGALEVRLSRYLGLWSLVVVVFAMQCCVNDAVNARVWSPITYLRWSGVQWLTWAGLAPLVFRLGERHPLPFPLSFRALLRHIGYSIGVTLLAMVIGALVSSLFEPTGFGEQLWQFVSKHFATGLLAYWSLLAVQQLLHFQAEKARREPVSAPGRDRWRRLLHQCATVRVLEAHPADHRRGARAWRHVLAGERRRRALPGAVATVHRRGIRGAARGRARVISRNLRFRPVHALRHWPASLPGCGPAVA